MSNTVTLRNGNITVFYTVLSPDLLRRRVVIGMPNSPAVDDVTIFDDLGGEAEHVLAELVADRLDEGFEQS